MAKPEAPTIETPRLVLRRREEGDIPFMTEMFGQESVRAYLGGVPPTDTHSMLRIVRARRQTDWHIIMKDTDTFIGECGLNRIVSGYLGEVSYILREEYWGKGIAFEAMQAVTEHSFIILGLGRLFAEIDNRNLRSKKLAERLGFTLDAVIPEGDLGGRIADISYYSRTV